ncbi:MAG: pseudouridine synthase [Gammaproteobacteria bacterium]|nr:pseudouridine synthase [Gammaproteobacteria bacterium]
MTHLILFNKPYGVLSQFTDSNDRATLADYIDQKGFYPAGRLDRDSEGLLLLTDDGQLQHQLANPKKRTWKRYWVEVENIPDQSAIDQIIKGLTLKDGPTLPAKARFIPPPDLWSRDPPVRFRANIPTQWLEIWIREGRNRQVRRMTAAMGHPTLRLVRAGIGAWELDELQPGEMKMVEVANPRSNKTRLPTNSNKRQYPTHHRDKRKR